MHFTDLYAAFVLDPDGYWIEVVQNERIKKLVGW
jgi:hypothetical protein